MKDLDEIRKNIDGNWYYKCNLCKNGRSKQILDVTNTTNLEIVIHRDVKNVYM